jgi:hypothetical protein
MKYKFEEPEAVFRCMIFASLPRKVTQYRRPRLANRESDSQTTVYCAGFLEQYMGVKNRLRTGLSYRSARLRRLEKSAGRTACHEKFVTECAFREKCVLSPIKTKKYVLGLLRNFLEATYVHFFLSLTIAKQSQNIHITGKTPYAHILDETKT